MSTATPMKFEKRNFMGIELDVLVGHPEHELLFVANQVARAAGLKHHNTVTNFKNSSVCNLRLSLGEAIKVANFTGDLPPDPSGRAFQSRTTLFDEANAYLMLIRGHAPASEPFRKWVTEEVLPTIRKTGKYNAEESSNPIAQGIMDELKLLRGEVASLRGFLETHAATVMTAPYGSKQAVEPSPYEGVTKGTVWYHFDKQALRKAGESLRMSVPNVDKLKSAVVLQLEKVLVAKWREADTRLLDAEFSAGSNRNWTLWPVPFLKSNLMHTHYVDALATVMNEKITR